MKLPPHFRKILIKSNGYLLSLLASGLAVAGSITSVPTTNVVIYDLAGGSGVGHNGNLGGRAGADALCAASAAKPTGFAQYRAFISVSTSDSIANMPTNYGLPATAPVVGNWNSVNSIFSTGWTNMLGTSGLAMTMQLANGVTNMGYWTGSNADGTFDSARNCSGWTNGTISFDATAGTHNDANSPGWITGTGPITCDTLYNLLCVAFTPVSSAVSAPIDLRISSHPTTYSEEINAK
jgi:hypothetical protein